MSHAPAVDYVIEATREAENAVAALRSLSFAEAASLPRTESRNITIAGANSSLTIFRYSDAHLLEGQLLLVVSVARPRWLGMTSQQIERGLVFASDGAVREATITELQNSGG